MENISESTNVKILQEITVNFNHSITINTLDKEAKLSDLKAKINKEFLLDSQEYDIFIKDLQLMVINEDLTISHLVQTYQTNEFTIKAYKNILDLKEQLTEYNAFLDYNIGKEEEKLKDLEMSFLNLQKELNTQE